MEVITCCDETPCYLCDVCTERYAELLDAEHLALLERDYDDMLDAIAERIMQGSEHHMYK